MYVAKYDAIKYAVDKTANKPNMTQFDSIT